MSTKDIEKALLLTFDDQKLSKNEKYAFRQILQDYAEDDDKLAFARNQAFDMVADYNRQGGQFQNQAFKWLEQVVKTIDMVRQTTKTPYQSESFFSPGDQCKKMIISLIKNAKKKIDICVFTISDDDIVQQLLESFEKGINVRVITDNDKANDRGSDVDRMIGAGLDVVKDQTSNHMHHKFALFDDKCLLNGSFNWTRSASKYNHENVVVSYEVGLIKDFIQEFDRLWFEFTSFK